MASTKERIKFQWRFDWPMLSQLEIFWSDDFEGTLYLLFWWY